MTASSALRRLHPRVLHAPRQESRARRRHQPLPPWRRLRRRRTRQDRHRARLPRRRLLRRHPRRGQPKPGSHDGRPILRGGIGPQGLAHFAGR
ncbi:peroxidase 63 [Phtheirospermum japonicum]|uniref:Peroxidase 63 n=1 Tax=Phtheirospermum japonicum TaxID=374723 RepID=A0A830D9X2_9LAMI|nr:peroxidase 63 [Phtheirospermum japonicum]